MPLGLLGKKLGSTRVYDSRGVVVPVTVVLAGPNRVLQVKTQSGKDATMPFNSVSTSKGTASHQAVLGTSKSKMARGETHPRIPEFLQGS